MPEEGYPVDPAADTRLETLMQMAHQTAVKKGWWEQDRNFGEMIALMHSELSEALEHYRSQMSFGTIFYHPDGKPDGIPVEFADLLIRVFDACEKLQIPLIRALHIKMAYNEIRPHRHGNKLA